MLAGQKRISRISTSTSVTSPVATTESSAALAPSPTAAGSPATPNTTASTRVAAAAVKLPSGDLTPALPTPARSEEHTSELQSRGHLVCRLLLETKNKSTNSSKISK